MERRWPAEPAAASAFCAALGIANDTGYPPPLAGSAVAADDPDLVALRVRIRVRLGEGRARYCLWAGSDIREGNLMADRRGQLKLVDPVGVAGWKIEYCWPTSPTTSWQTSSPSPSSAPAARAMPSGRRS